MITYNILLEARTIAKHIEAATDRNDHTGAAVLLANFVGGKYPEILKAIEDICRIEGHTPYEVGLYRRELVKEMIGMTYAIHGDNVAAIIDSVF